MIFASRFFATILVIALFAPAIAWAQADRCSVPQRLPETDERVGIQGPRRVVPVGGYTLALTWNPGFCRQAANRHRFQCDRRNRFGFVLHGLWPDGRGASWPQFCAAPAHIPEATVRRNLCAMPSPALQRHQYAKHGTCSGLGPADYLDRAASLYARIRYPDMDGLSRRPTLNAGQFAMAFARANPGMTPAMLRIGAGRDRWLDEVWLCLDTRFRPRACPGHQRTVPPNTRLRIWRGS